MGARGIAASDPEKKKRMQELGHNLFPILSGILLNLACSNMEHLLRTPLFFDTIGTIVASVLGGYLPGILVALISNMIRNIFTEYAAYYGVLNALIAIVTVYFYRKGWLRKRFSLILYTLLLTGIGGGLGWLMMQILCRGGIEERYATIVHSLALRGWTGRTASFAAVFLLDLVDKSFTVLLVAILLYFLPEEFLTRFRMEAWKQEPLDDAAMKAAESLQCRRSLNYKVIMVLVAVTALLSLTAAWISLLLFRNYSIEQHKELASGVASAAAGVIDPGMVEDYLTRGRSVRGYRETERLLYRLRESTPVVEYVYVYQIREDGCHVVFDLDTEEMEGSEPGDVIPFDEAFMPYVPSLLDGKEIEPIISDDTYGWLMSAYRPVYDATGRCVCYAAADIKMLNLREYEAEFMVKMLSLFLGFFLLIVAACLWLARFHLILPINSMAQSARAFAYGEDSDMEESMRRIRALRIRTGDEVEHLYQAFCKTMEDSVHFAEDLRQQKETIDEMQSGLIVILADLVENRDENTGDHIKKTAAYTRIIMEGLRRKGYYADQLTDKFMEDVEKSAPLHDVGKIHVPDAILNKPGKLTDEEFEIMKTHTTAGRKIMEEAIAKVHGESYLTEARNLAGYHHEKWNGRGYPEGLAGEEIPLSARIMAVADVFDALVSKRVYKPAFSFDKAMSIIREDAGTHFDPRVAEVFLEALDEVKAVAEHFDSLRRSAEEKTDGEEEKKSDGEI